MGSVGEREDSTSLATRGKRQASYVEARGVRGAVRWAMRSARSWGHGRLGKRQEEAPLALERLADREVALAWDRSDMRDLVAPAGKLRKGLFATRWNPGRGCGPVPRTSWSP